MKHHTFPFIPCAVLSVILLTGCQTSSEPEQIPEAVEGTFDPEVVRHDIVIQGYAFTLPQKLSELEEGLTYEFGETYTAGSYKSYEVKISDQNGTILEALTYKKSASGTIHNIAVKDSNSSIGGITPGVTTQEELLRRYGEPTEQKESASRLICIYGNKIASETVEDDNHGQYMTIVIGEDQIVSSAAMTYRD